MRRSISEVKTFRAGLALAGWVTQTEAFVLILLFSPRPTARVLSATPSRFVDNEWLKSHMVDLGARAWTHIAYTDSKVSVEVLKFGPRAIPICRSCYVASLSGFSCWTVTQYGENICPPGLGSRDWAAFSHSVYIEIYTLKRVSTSYYSTPAVTLHYCHKRISFSSLINFKPNSACPTCLKATI